MASASSNAPPGSKVEALAKILELEKQKGYQDKAVGGGLDAFLQRWAAELRPALGSLSTYSSLAPEERRQWAARVLSRIAAQPDAVPPKQDQPQRTVGAGFKPAPTPGMRRAIERPKPPPPKAISLSDGVLVLKWMRRDDIARLKKLGVETVRDLVYLFPFRHNDFANIRKVSELEYGKEQTVAVSVWEATRTQLGPNPRRASTQAVLGDETGNVRAVWFNQGFLADKFRPGTKMLLSGKVSVFRGQFVFESPEYEVLRGQEELLNAARLVPVYPSTEGLWQRSLRRYVKKALDAGVPQLEEFLPEDIRHREGLMELRNAVAQLHYPDSMADWNAARRRLAFDELLVVQLAVLQRRRAWQSQRVGIPLRVAQATDGFLASLPFALTGAQKDTIQEILADITKDTPMARMLQGDVGSGKTVVALTALVAAIADGYQGAIMAPTEILAEQHYLSMRRLLSGGTAFEHPGAIVSIKAPWSPKPITVALLVGSLTKRVKDDVQRLVSSGQVDLVIGTHALLQSGVELPRLAVAVVDEQHRFGVMQRASLQDKGPRPHLLAISATPIPRSLYLTLYGDLDVSVLDEMPPGRKEIRTRLVPPDSRETAYEFIRREVKADRQAFVVCPLIEESEALQTRAATAEYERLSAQVFPDLRLGLLHGRLPLREKERVMDAFQRRELDILVSTPVIEVGIDIPNATVMAIEGADRFGLAQLHQLRGRVGRGEHQSYCLLLADAPGGDAQERLKLVERLHDGFRLAEEDLRLRGPGDYIGTRQSGYPEFKVARLTDQDILAMARREASRLLEADPDLRSEEHVGLARLVERYTQAIAGEFS